MVCPEAAKYKPLFKRVVFCNSDVLGFRGKIIRLEECSAYDKGYTSGTDTHKVTQWDRSGGPDMKPTGDDTKKTGTDPQPKAWSADPKKV